MEEYNIRDYIRKELLSNEQKVALDFVGYLESKSLVFYKDNSNCWKDKIYYWVKLNNKCVCFIAIKDPDDSENHWTVWSDDFGSDFLENYPFDNKLKQTAWKYIDHCEHCGSCGGGRHKIVFGKEFYDVCGCTFRIDNPTDKDLEFLKVMVDIRVNEINSSFKYPHAP